VPEISTVDIPGAHGRPQKFFLDGRQRRNFAYPFQSAIDAMHMDVHKTLYLFYITMKMPTNRVLWQQSQNALRWQP